MQADSLSGTSVLPYECRVTGIASGIILNPQSTFYLKHWRRLPWSSYTHSSSIFSFAGGQSGSETESSSYTGLKMLGNTMLIPMLGACIGKFNQAFPGLFKYFNAHSCLYSSHFPWGELLEEIQCEGQRCIVSSKKEWVLDFNGKEFNVLRESKGGDVCDTSSV